MATSNSTNTMQVDADKGNNDHHIPKVTSSRGWNVRLDDPVKIELMDPNKVNDVPTGDDQEDNSFAKKSPGFSSNLHIHDIKMEPGMFEPDLSANEMTEAYTDDYRGEYSGLWATDHSCNHGRSRSEEELTGNSCEVFNQISQIKQEPCDFIEAGALYLGCREKYSDPCGIENPYNFCHGGTPNEEQKYMIQIKHEPAYNSHLQDTCDFTEPVNGNMVENFSEQYIHRAKLEKQTTSDTDVTINNCSVVEGDSRSTDQDSTELEMNRITEYPDIVDHGITQTVDANYKCDLCNYTTEELSALRCHYGTIHEEETTYSCDLCSYSTTQPASLKMHIEKHINKKYIGETNHICDQCSYKADNLMSLIVHQGWHKREKTYKCEICNFSTSMKNSLKAHEAKMHKREAKKFKCKSCDFSTPYFHNLKRHTDRCLRKKEKTQYKCEECSYSTTLPYRFKEHRIEHLKGKYYYCAKCSYKAESVWDFKKHKLQHADEDRPYKCDQCSYRGQWPKQVKLHKRRRHTNERPYSCEMCCYRAKTQHDVNRHKWIHAKEKPFKCDECSYSTDRTYNLRLHYTIHSGEKPFKCDQCSYRGQCPMQVKSHKLRQHTNKNERPFSCEMCSYRAKTQHDMDRHKWTHAKEKPFKCDECSYTTDRIYRLRLHKMVHSGEKPFKCDLCTYGTTRSSDLKDHKMRHHASDTPYKCGICEFATVRSGLLKFHIERKHKEKTSSWCNSPFTKPEEKITILQKHTHDPKTTVKEEECDSINSIDTFHIKDQENICKVEKPFDISDISAKSASIVKEHREIHSNEKKNIYNTRIEPVGEPYREVCQSP